MRKEILPEEKMRRLRWKVRRGMLELDLALSQFLEHRYTGLDKSLQQQFELLLDQEDDVLFGWIMGHRAVDEVQFQVIVECIQAMTYS